jgi:hypothetical protein
MIFQLFKNDLNDRSFPSSRLLFFGGMLFIVCLSDCVSPVDFGSNSLVSTARAAMQDGELGQVSMELINGTTIVSSLKTISSEGEVGGDAIPPGLNIRQVLSIKATRKFSAIQKDKMRLEFVGGGELWIDSVSMADEKIESISSLGVRELPLELLRAIVWANSPLIDRKIKTPSADFDMVVVDTSAGERVVEGILEAVDSEFVRIQYKGELKKIGLEKVKAIVTADLGLKKPEGSVAVIQLVDGSQVVGEILELEGGVLEVGVTAEKSVQVPAGIVVSVAIKSDRLRYLSDQEPLEVQEKSIFAFQRPWKKNRSVAGNPLEIRLKNSEEIRSFKKGLGMQASSRLVFANEAGFDRFSAVAGIAAETKGRGDCQMIVRGDGIELWSKRVTGSGGPLEINVDIEGIKEVVLVVSPGAEFDLGDHANWGEARFLKTK